MDWFERMHNQWLEPPDDPEPTPEWPDEDWRWEDEKIAKHSNEKPQKTKNNAPLCED